MQAVCNLHVHWLEEGFISEVQTLHGYWLIYRISSHEVIHVTVLAIVHHHVILVKWLSIDDNCLILVELIYLNNVWMALKWLSNSKLTLGTLLWFRILIWLKHLNALILQLMRSLKVSDINLGLVTISYLPDTCDRHAFVTGLYFLFGLKLGLLLENLDILLARILLDLQTPSLLCLGYSRLSVLDLMSMWRLAVDTWYFVDSMMAIRVRRWRAACLLETVHFLVSHILPIDWYTLRQYLYLSGVYLLNLPVFKIDLIPESNQNLSLLLDC